MNGDINSRFLAMMNYLINVLNFAEGDIQETMIQSFDPLAASKNTNYVSLCQKFINTSTLAADQTLNLIGQNDAFAPLGIRQVFRKRYATATTSTTANCDIVSYPDPYLFDATGEFAQIRDAFYGSRSSLLVETTSVIEALLFQQLSYSGYPDMAAATFAGSGSANNFDRFTPFQRKMVFSGLTNVQLQVGLFGFTPAAAITGDTNEANDIGFQLVGLTIKGAGQRVSDLSQQQSSKCVIAR